jgi:hypothetical protein
LVPKRNYGFEKRQKELAKQDKRAAKLQRRLERQRPDEVTPDTGPAQPDPPGPTDSKSPEGS